MSTDQPNSSEEFPFEVELDWCLKYINDKIHTKGISNKEGNLCLQALKILKNEKAPFIKKRQAMRQACGDYRKLMKEEKELMDKQMKSNEVTKVKESTNGHVVRRKKVSLTQDEPVKSAEKSPFRFNFTIPD